MGIGIDEKLTIAINGELAGNRLSEIDDANVRQIAEQLNESFPHRSVEEIESRMKLMFWSRGVSILSKIS
nr:hypothetical protein REQ54_04302 [Rhizobium sp. Q54]